MADRIGLYNPSTGTFFLNNDLAAGAADTTFRFGPADSALQGLVGDWDGADADGVGFYNSTTGTFFLRDALSAGNADYTFRFGASASTAEAIAGDWDGVGGDGIGLYDASTGTFFLKNSLTAGSADTSFRFGPAGNDWTPIVGDWDNDGDETVGLYDAATGTFYLKNSNAAGPADLTFRFGAANQGWEPVIGDWNGDGTDSIGLYNPAAGTYFLKNSNSAGNADISFNFGGVNSAYQPIAGEWVSAPTFTLTAAATPAQVNEGSSLTFTVTLSAAQATATTVTFQLQPGNGTAANQGTTTTNTNDFSGGAFNPVSVVIPAGELTATFSVTPAADTLTELPETFSVDATIAGLGTQSLVATVLDGGLSGGQTFTLTANTDNIIGTSGDDTITGSDNTWQSDDLMNGGQGTDTLNLTLAATASRLIQSTAVENISINASAAVTANMISATGYETLASRYSADTVNYTNVRALAAVEANGVTGGEQLNVQFADALVSGTTDAVTVRAKDGADVNIGLGNAGGTQEFETINLASSGSANDVTFNKASDGAAALAGLKTLNVTGAADLTLALDMTTATGMTVDAGTFEGKLTANVTDAAITKITGGKGDDTIDLTGADVTNLVAAKTIDGGAGTNTLVIDADLTSLTSSHATDKHSFTNIQNVLISVTDDGDTDADLDASLVTGLQTVTVTVTDNANDGDAESTLITNLAAGQSVIAKDSGTATGAVTDADDGVAISAALKDASGTADSLAVTLTDSTLLSLTAADDGSSNGIETVAITSSGTSTAGNLVSALVASKATGITIGGSQKLGIATAAAGAAAIDLATPASGKAQSIDASKMTGNLTIGSAATAGFEAVAVDLKLGSGTNTVYFGTTLGTTDTITGATGKDTVSATDAAAATTIEATLSGVETLELLTNSTTNGTNTFSLKNATGLQTVKIVAEADNAGDGISISNVNGQTIEVVTADNTTDTEFSSEVISVGLATGVTGATVKISGNDTFSGAIKTSGTLTLNDATKTAGGAYIDQTIDLDGTSGTAKLTKMVATGGGVKTGTTLSTLTVTTNDANVALTEIDATGYNGNLTLTGLTGTELGEAAAIKTAQGSTTVTVAAAKLAADQLVFTDTGTSGTDTIAATGIGDNLGVDDNVRVKSTGFEVLDLALVQTSEVDTTIDLRDAAGLNKVVLSVADDGGGTATAFDKDINLNNLADGATVELKGVDTNGTNFVEGSGNVFNVNATQTGAQSVTFVAAGSGALKVDANATGEGLVLGSTYKTATIKQGAANNLVVEELSASGLTTLNLGGQDKNSTGTAYTGNITVNAAVAAALTTVNIDATNGDVTFADATSTLTKLATITVAGAAGQTVTIGDDTAVTVSDLATINGASAAADITIGTGIAYKNGATITTGTGDDSIALNTNLQANAVIDAGGNPSTTPTGDFLILTGTALGASTIDLSSSTDQITQINGSANTAAQKGFENVDASALTGSGGVQVTAISGTAGQTGSTIEGSVNADIITLGSGIDTVVLFDGMAATPVANTVVTSKVDTIFSFTTGTGGDQFDVSGLTLAGAVDNVLEVAGTANIAAGLAGSDRNVIVLTDNDLSASTVKDALDTIDLGANPRLLFIDEGTSVKGYLVANNDTTDNGGVTMVQIVELSGIADIGAGTFAAGNFVW